MGNRPLNPSFKFYGTSVHPIEGQVTVYSLAGEGTFAMSVFEPTASERIELLSQIGKEESSKLITYYGTCENKELFVNCQARMKEDYEPQAISYWEFLNYDLNNLINKEQNYISEQTLIEVLENIAQAALTLAKYGVYPDIQPQYIQFTTGLQAKLYWSNILPLNMHRPYFRYFHLGEYQHALYAPEEMYTIKQRSFNHKINMEKCVVFSLGLILLQAATGVDVREIYHYKNFEILKDKKEKLIQSIERVYSFQFMELLKGTLNASLSSRMCYNDILKSTSQMKQQYSSSKDTKQNLNKVSLRVVPT